MKRGEEEDFMGRTVPTFTMVVQQELQSWSKFRRGLRRDDQEAFDELFRAARLQLASSAYAARPIPFESIAMSMLLVQHRALRNCEELIRRLDERVATLEGHDPGSPSGRTENVPAEEDTGEGAKDHRLAV
jgi:hypothetical protein